MSSTFFKHLISQNCRVEFVDLQKIDAYVELFNRASKKMVGEPEFTVEEYRVEYETPGFDPESATRVVVSPEGIPIGLVEVWDLDETPVHPFIWARVDPEWEGRGIGTAMMQWGFKRAQEALKRVPPQLRVSAFASVQANYEPAMQLLSNLRMQPVRHFWRMAIDLEQSPPAPEWPDGIMLKPFDPGADMEAVFRAEDEAFRDHWGYVEQPFIKKFQEWKHLTLNKPNFDPGLWFLAVDGTEIAGLSRCVASTTQDADMGWVQVLGVRRPWRKRGLGLALLRHSLCTFHQIGKARAGLGVDAGNLTGATRLYEDAGMHITRANTSFEYQLQPGEELMTEEAPE
ncbi:MAG: GNAT family N-acetyltransferase [Anaerolineales bacterium]|nr:GNAT family N-acetyltransferase [Anaerolineales bacterium]